jgi:glycosyltransferase involved in cell wall biosynthesis
MHSPKILFVHKSVPTYRAPFFKLLDKQFDIRFVFTNPEAVDIFYGESYQRTLSELKLREAKLCKRHLSIAPPFLEEVSLELMKYLFAGDFDVIVDNLQSIKILLSLLASVIRKKPLIVWTEQWYDFEQSFSGRLKSLVLAAVLRKSSAILVAGVKAREFVYKFHVNPDLVFTMPSVSLLESSAVDPQERPKFKEDHGIVDKQIILYVGRLVERKGVEYLINAFSVLRRETDDVTLLIVGEGPCRARLQDLANHISTSGAVHFLGRVEKEELATIYRASTIAVVPSVTGIMKEPWGLVLNEAMQFGKPVIATEAVGAAYDLIEEPRNGFLVPERDEHALYEKLKLLVGDEKLVRQMGAESRRIIEERYQYADMVKAFSSAVTYVCERKADSENE